MVNSKNKRRHDKFADLRRRAQVFLSSDQGKAPDMSPEEIKKLVHELDTYQIELELQNEDLRYAQQKLEESRRRYTDLYDFAPVGYLTLNSKGLIIEANLTAADVLGRARNHLFKQPLSAFIIDDDQDIYYHHRKKLLESLGQERCELRLRKRDGSVLYVQMESAVRKEVDGSRGQFRTIVTDISKLKELEEDLSQSAREWENTFNAINDIIFLQDKDMRILRANKAAHDFFRANSGELNGVCCYELFRGSSEPCTECTQMVALAEKKTHAANIIFENLGKIFHITSSPLIDENGEVTQLVHVAKDITEQKRLEEALFQAHKMEAIGTLAGGIAHDFNNIMQVILGYAELAGSAPPGTNRSREHLDMIIKAGTRAKELVEQMLTYSRKNVELSQSVPLAPIVKEALKLIRVSLPMTIEIREEIDPDCGFVMSSPTLIHQVLINLCTNAWHAMEGEKGTLSVQLTRVKTKRPDTVLEGIEIEREYIRLLVKDTGSGMSQNTMNRIFEPYYTSKQHGKGSGMGLALVHGIVQRCGGFIEVESKLGHGTAFSLYFPVSEENSADAEKYATVAQDKKQESLPTGTERILVVDDEEGILSLYKTSLERLGYKVTAYCNSTDTLKTFQAAPDNFDLLITDQTMPDLSGAELAVKVLQIRPDMPVILCTGYSSILSKEKAEEIGIKKFITKPIRRRDLAVAVREVFDKK